MNLKVEPKKTYALHVGDGVVVGNLEIHEVRADLALGEFYKNEEFGKYSDIFKAYEDAINSQMLSIIDKIELEIEAMGFYITDFAVRNVDRLRIFDLQIFDGHKISFRLNSYTA